MASPSYVANICWDNDAQLQVINESSFIANLNNNQNANYVKWSPDNQFVALNLMDKLIILETNIHSINGDKFYFVNDSIGQRLCFRSVDIKPIKDFQLQIVNDEINSKYKGKVESFLFLPPKVQPRFVDFEFCPFEISKSFHLLACLTDQNVLLIYLNIVPLEWSIICNISKLFAELYQKESSKSDVKQNEDYFDKLDRIRISAFTWHPKVNYQNDNNQQTEIHYHMYFATRIGSLHFVRLILNSLAECNMEIIKTVQTDLRQIITLKILSEKILLIQSNDGRLMLYQHDLSRKILLWTQIDKRPSYNFAINNNDGLAEIIFSKYRFILMINVDVNNFSINSIKEISIHQPLDDLEKFNYDDIFAVFNLNSYYCFTTLNDDIYTFQRNTSQIEDDDNETIFMRKLIIPSHKKNDDVHFVCLAPSSNHALLAILSRQCRFSGRLSNFKTENVHLYLGTMLLDPSSVTMSLTKRLLSPPDHSSNFADLLYLFRYNLLRPDCSQTQLKMMIDVLLLRVPLWMHQNSMKLEETFECLRRMKFIRYLTRYCLVDGEKFLFFQDNQQDLLHKLVEKLNYLILKNHFKRILQKHMPIDDQDTIRWYEKFNVEHLVSLYNLIKSDIIDFLSERTVDHIFKLVQNDKAKLDSFKSITEDSQPFINPLKKVFNSCSFCYREVENPGSFYLNIQHEDYKCQGHQVDVDSNSFLIIDPLKHSIETCRKCFESKLMVLIIDQTSLSLWPDPQILPFKLASKTCLFCS